MKHRLETVQSVLLFCVLLASSVRANDGIVRWDFSAEQTTPLDFRGSVKRDQAGPRPPEFPDFPGDNTAIELDGSGYVAVPGLENEDRFKFDQGDSITLEAWVRLDEAREGQQMYVVGKGRTAQPGVARDNQNWALRTVAHQGIVKVSFLFATERMPSGSHWHRWTSMEGFDRKSGWHHIAVAYQFGSPETIRGWIDGQPVKGNWDMGGKTKLPPVVDDDDVWIGSARGGSRSNSFHGAIDEVAVHRSILSDETIASRFNRIGGPQLKITTPQEAVMPAIDDVPPGQVLVTLSEGLPSNARWLNQDETWPNETDRLVTDEFLLPRIPARFDGTGLRSAWQPPVLMRMAADVRLPVGTHRLLLRARSLSRLWIEGELVATTQRNSHRRTNLNPMETIASPPSPGMRLVRFPQQESFGEFEIREPSGNATKLTRVVLELVVGGKQNRVETGEVCVAFQPHHEGAFLVLAETPSLPLTDNAVEPRLFAIEHAIVSHEDQIRRRAAASVNRYWEERHAFARRAVGAKQGQKSKQVHDIDVLLSEKIRAAKSRSIGTDPEVTANFNENVLPILRGECFRCHGEKTKGGLRLNSREAMRGAGESELPAVVPGHPDQSQLIVQVREGAMPPTDEGLSKEQIKTLEKWVAEGAIWPAESISLSEVAIPPAIDDAAFMRRVYLDTVGVPPTTDEAKQFLNDPMEHRRKRLVARLLRDDRFADHWVSFWLDLLAENPTLLNTSLGSTGPFRWFLHDSLRDDKPLDRMVTELIMMRGSPHNGGPAGFGIAGENDSPMAAKAHVLASAFLGIELQCARCHDSPYHSTTQKDLYSLAAMLDRKTIVPPKSSRVPDEFFENQARESLIRVTLGAGEKVEPKWPFESLVGVKDDDQLQQLVSDRNDRRERLAALFTSPLNRRFSRVMVNHFWNRLIGAGFVEPVNDWESKTASHPELLDWLAKELVTHDYDQKHVISFILNSDVYAREAIGRNASSTAERRFFAAPDRRRLSAEQIVDSLFVAAGQRMDVEELTFVHDGTHPMSSRLTLGKPKRAWMFAGLNNERDRPSLSMPRSRAIVDVLEAFGWTGTRQNPVAEREVDPNVLQPGILANGDLTMALTRASYESPLALLAMNRLTPGAIVDELFLRFLSRSPTQGERTVFTNALTDGFDHRLVDPVFVELPEPDKPLPIATWTNHLRPEANEVQLEIARRVRRGPPVDPRLESTWRERYEDMIWSLVNHREFVWMP